MDTTKRRASVCKNVSRGNHGRSSHVDTRYRKSPRIARPISAFLRGLFRTFFRAGVTGALCAGPALGCAAQNVEAMALAQDVAPRTLQRFLESIVWDEAKLRDRCQQLVASQHADPHAIGCVAESGTAKSRNHTTGVKRQYNGNRGKIENCVNGVAISYSAPGFTCLLDVRKRPICPCPIRPSRTVPVLNPLRQQGTITSEPNQRHRQREAR